MNKKDIINFLESIQISKYEIHTDLSVSVYGDVNISQMKLRELPINFNNIYGDFNCSYNFLSTLKGCPNFIEGDFNCNRNDLLIIDYVPQKITGNVYFLINNINRFDFPFKSVSGFIYLDGDTNVNKKYKNLDKVKYDNDNYYYLISDYNKDYKFYKRSKILSKLINK